MFSFRTKTNRPYYNFTLCFFVEYTISLPQIYFVLTIKIDPRIDQKCFLSSLCLEIRMDVKLICFETLFQVKQNKSPKNYVGGQLKISN